MKELLAFDNLQPMDQGIVHGHGPPQNVIEAAEGGWASTHVAN